MSRVLVVVFACVVLAACTTERTTTTSRTATEQILLSAAAERAATAVAKDVPPNKKTFVVADNFEAVDGKQAIGAIRAAILAHGAALVADRAEAEQIVEIRSGALGIDNSDTIVGIRETNLPIPLTQGNITFPKIAFFEKVRQIGIAKFAIAIYDAKTGLAITSPAPKFGYARKNDYTAAFAISWKRDDIYEPDSAATQTLELAPEVNGAWAPWAPPPDATAPTPTNAEPVQP